MNSIPVVAQYFIGTIAATMSGIIYWQIIENLQPKRLEPRRFEKLWLAALLSVLITPLGAWFVASSIKMRRMAREIKSQDRIGDRK